MLMQEIRNIKSGEKELRSFANVMAIALAVLAGLGAWRGKESWPIFLIVAVSFFCAGRFAPGILKPTQKIWMTLALMMGWVMTRVILSIFFYLAVTPLSLISKIAGYRFLDLKFPDPVKKTFWIQKTNQGADKTRYEKQF